MGNKASHDSSEPVVISKADGTVIPTFTELKGDFFTHHYKDHKSWPIMDLITFDPYGDGSQAIMITGHNGQKNCVFVWRDGSLQDCAAELGLEGPVDDTCYGLAAADLNGDGLQEIVVCQHSGVYVYSRTKQNPVFTATKIDIPLVEFARPVTVAISDTTKSGCPDLFIGTFIDHAKHSTANFNNPKYRVDNAFWRNNGDGTFRDASAESGLDLHANTFMGVFADLNGNGYDDLVLGTNTSQAFVYENNKDGTFTQHTLPIGYGFWMGAVVGNITGGKYPDIYLANAGLRVPKMMMYGDLKRKTQPLDVEFRLLKNDGKFGFTECAKDMGLRNPGFGWGMVLDDFSNSGSNQIYTTENFIGMPMKMHSMIPTRGAFYVKNSEGKYVNTVKQAGLSNSMFGYRAVSLDLNGNGHKDLVVANIDGPMRVFLNDAKMTEMIPEAQNEVETGEKAPKVHDCADPKCSVCSKELVANDDIEVEE